MLLLLACSAAPPTVLFVVLDTVRADRTSLCGYGRPTTPKLDALAAGGRFTCSAYAPAPWTLPSHASYFTGTPSLVHGLDSSGAADAVTLAWRPARPLDARLPTLAEHFTAQGWTSIGIAENPTLTPITGLTRGFDLFDTAPRFGARPAWTLGRLDAALETARDEPLFLFVNLTGAHEPLDAVPDGLGWVPAAPGQETNSRNPMSPAVRLENGTLSEAKRSAWLQDLSNAYDYGVWRADDLLGAVLDRVEAARGRPMRVVVTSDHGELLGEGQRVGHGRFLDEPLVRIPLVVSTNVSLPEPFPGAGVYSLVRGEPALLPPVEAMVAPGNLPGQAGVPRARGTLGLASWKGSLKTIIEPGVRKTVDLAVDPSGQATAIVPWVDDEIAARHAAWVQRYHSPAGAGAAELHDELRALGYAD